MIPPTRELTVLALSFWCAGCVLGETEPAPPTSTEERDSSGQTTLAAFTLPDLTHLAEPVRRQVSERVARLAEQVAARDITPAELADTYGDLGRLLLAAELTSAAQTAFRHAQRLVPDDPRWPYYLGHVALATSDRSGAITAFGRASTLDPTDLPTLIWLAETYLDDGRPAEAEDLFLSAASQDPSSAAARFGAGRAALARDAHADAVEHFEATLALDPQASAVHYPLAMAYRALGDRPQAETHLRQRGESWPALPDPLMAPQRELLESVTAYEIRGNDAMAVGDWAGAATAFRAGLELEPDDPALRHRLGGALYAMGDVPGAIAELEQVVRASPDFAGAHISLGTILSVQGDYAQAIQRFSVGLESDPNSVEGRFGLAEVLRVSGQPERSLPQYDRVIQLDPTIVEAWIGRVAALIALERHQDARDTLAEAGRVHPGHLRLNEVAALLPPS